MTATKIASAYQSTPKDRAGAASSGMPANTGKASSPITTETQSRRLVKRTTLEAPLAPEARTKAMGAAAASVLALRDIGEVSFGAREVSSARDMVDNRRAIRNTEEYPWRAVAHLRINTAAGPFRGTGWFIGPRAVLTAGHALFLRSHESGVPSGWVKSVTVTPGYNGGRIEFGSIVSSSFESLDGWTQKGDERADLGVIFLDEPVGTSTGRLLFDSDATSELIGGPANLVGYPSERPDLTEPDGLLWHSARRVMEVDDSFVYYDMAAAPGQSGSPVYRFFGQYPRAFAMHCYAASGTNVGLRFTEKICERLREWRLHGINL